MTILDLCPPSSDDAAGIVVRRIDRQDAAHVEAMWGRCSEVTRSRRFLGGRAEARYLLGDPRHPTARIDVGAFVDGVLVAVGSLVSGGAGEWEAALLVADLWQGRGVGRVVTEALSRAGLAAGVREVTLTTPADSEAVPRLARRVAARLVPVWSGSGVAEYRLLLGRISSSGLAARG